MSLVADARLHPAPSRRKGRSQLGLSAEIPTASTADVAFLLVVFFMLTSVFSATMGLDFHFPEEDPQATVVEPLESVLVEVVADGSLIVDGRTMAVAGLLPYLAPKLEAAPAKPVIVRGGLETPYGRWVETLDLLRRGQEILALPRPIEIVLPTEREIRDFWP